MARRGDILGGGSFWQPLSQAPKHMRKKGKLRDGRVQRQVLALIDLDQSSQQPQLIDVDFLPHALCFDPLRPHVASLFEKHGPGACQIDLRTRQQLRRIPTRSNHHFYGHGAYSTDGTLLYATESILDEKRRGVLVVRDSQSLEVLGEVPTAGTAPHDCILLDDGCTLVVTNGGGDYQRGATGSVAYIDAASGKLLERVEVPKRRFNAGHIAVAADGRAAVVSAPREGLPSSLRSLGAVSVLSPGQGMRTVREPETVTKRMAGEALSLAIDEKAERFAVSHPDGNLLSFWTLEDGEFCGAIDELNEPRGVVVDLQNEAFIVSHRMGGSVCLSSISLQTLAVSQLAFCNPCYISGSHIFCRDLRQLSAA